MSMPFHRYVSVVVLLAIVSCSKPPQEAPVPLEQIAANDEVLEFMKSFDGRGALTDSTQPMSPEQSLAAFRYPKDLSVSLVLAEPQVTQPVFAEFDHKGRLWVVQYNQYPYPKDLKVTSMDQHIRATFDKIPPPPGQGPKGADKVTFFEDTDGDGTFDRSTDAITGLNIATSVALGRGKIWVLNPPYLVAYPDADDDGRPDGPPAVHLQGFGIEDTHAVANSLHWGPDGWLYGAQGSTCTANVSSAVSKNVRFDGQAIWRYHPETQVFEVFAEGGGNTFDIEIDSKGRLYSGDNGASRGQYYKQGAYFVRNFGKHGALTNPYAFGHLANMEVVGEKVRFTHAFVRYEGGLLPERYADKMFAINPLQGFIQLSRFDARGSTFVVTDEERVVQTEDHWFRPVDITTGPDGAIYVVDWYDSRLSHVDPRDTWSKTNGRIYRIGNGGAKADTKAINLADLSSDDLIKILSHKNRWFRQQAQRIIADRKDGKMSKSLIRVLQEGDGQSALEALWALHAINALDDDLMSSSLRHTDPFVRMWAVRLTGDSPEVSPALMTSLAELSLKEKHAEVRSQLAATAKRLQGPQAVDIVGNLLRTAEDSNDADLPLQLWWALESKVAEQSESVLALFQDKSLWKNAVVRQVVLERLMQRFAAAADPGLLAACARMVELAPSANEVKILVNGLQEGLRGRELEELPAVLVNALKPYSKELGGDAVVMRLRQGDKEAVKHALEVIADHGAPVATRLSYIRVFGEIHEEGSVPVLLSVVESGRSSAALRESALMSLQRYDDRSIGTRVVKAYPDRLRADPGVREAALALFATRPDWSMDLIDAIDRKKKPGEKFVAHTISKDDVPEYIVRQMNMLNDTRVTGMTGRIWPDVRLATSEEKGKQIAQVSAILKQGSGDIASGEKVYEQTCGACHRLFEKGGTIGPDLTGYDRQNINDLLINIIDPNAFIREGYVSYRITTTDGRVLTGSILSKDAGTMSVRLLSGTVVTLAAKEVKDMEEMPSMMPDNLLTPLTDNQIRDLFAYLSKKTKVVAQANP